MTALEQCARETIDALRARVEELEGVLSTWTATAEANEKDARARIAELEGALRAHACRINYATGGRCSRGDIACDTFLAGEGEP